MNFLAAIAALYVTMFVGRSAGWFAGRSAGWYAGRYAGLQVSINAQIECCALHAMHILQCIDTMQKYICIVYKA
jgi:hypothetical protein